MTPEINKFVVHCHFGKHWHAEKIINELYKKYDLEITENQINDFVEAVTDYIHRYRESPHG
jgi:hypothetical protein